LAKKLCPNLYAGLFMPSELKSTHVSRLRRRRAFNCILNVGQHFVTVVARPGYLLYLDSFGLPALHKDVINFLHSLSSSREIFQNKKQIQRGSSMHCGLYALLFTCYFDKPQQSFRLHFTKMPGPRNDALCVDYLEKLVQ
ncbi:MAG: hypothetical protein MI867_05155, partial [Pseudomonadales bacterium]|nr:hypothetical protein [Pseudomonadales bacterium]